MLHKFLYFTATIVAAVLVGTAFSPCANAQSSEVTLKAGTPVILATTAPVSSKTVVSGTSVDFKVVSDVKVGKDVVIPAGTIAKGQVSSASKASALGKGGSITLSLNNLTAVDGSMVPLSGASVSAQGDDKTGLAIICGLCTLFGFLINGQQAELPAETQIQAVVMSNTTIAL